LFLGFRVTQVVAVVLRRYQLEQQAAKLNNDLNGVTPLYQVANVHLQKKTIKNLNYPVIGYQSYQYATEK